MLEIPSIRPGKPPRQLADSQISTAYAELMQQLNHR